MPLLAIHEFSIQPRLFNRTGRFQTEISYELEISNPNQNPLEASLTINSDNVDLFILDQDNQERKVVSWRERPLQTGPVKRGFTGFFVLRNRPATPVTVRITLRMTDRFNTTISRYISVICK